MGLLADRLMVEGASESEYYPNRSWIPPQHFRQMFGEGGVVIVDGTAVGEYVFAQDRKWDSTRINIPTNATEWDAPVLPPFERLWIEFLCPRAITAKSASLRHEMFENWGYALNTWRDDDGWGVTAIAIVQPSERLRVPPEIMGEMSFLVDALGRLSATTPIKLWPPEMGDSNAMLMGWLLEPLWDTLSFMNCKNVTLVENRPIRQQSRAQEREHGFPMLKFKTLNIRPMTRVLETEGGLAENGLKQALHICRGHFKNFDDKPLFGKHKGTYWWGSQLRGAAEQGAVIKTYSVSPPKEGNNGSTPGDT